MQDIESIYRRWVDELWNKGNLDIVDELFDENGTAYYPFFIAGDEPIRGRKNFQRFVIEASSKFTDVRSEITEMVSDSNRVTALSEICARFVHGNDEISQLPELVRAK